MKLSKEIKLKIDKIGTETNQHFSYSDTQLVILRVINHCLECIVYSQQIMRQKRNLVSYRFIMDKEPKYSRELTNW